METERLLYKGNDEMHGSIYLTHGCHYPVKVTRLKNKTITVTVYDCGMATVLKYKDEEELKKAWLSDEPGKELELQ